MALLGIYWMLICWRFYSFFANNCADVVCFVGVSLSPRGGYFVYFVLLILGFCSWLIVSYFCIL